MAMISPLADLERRQRHDEQMVHGAVLALAHDGGACQDNGEHGDVVNDAHDAGEPARRHIGVEGHADGESYGRLRDRLGPLHEASDFILYDLSRIARPDAGLVASTRSWIAGLRPARTSRSKYGGMSRTKVNRPRFMNRSMSLSWMETGFLK